MNETSFRKAISAKMTHLLCTQIESGGSAIGIPDTHYLKIGDDTVTGFMELKYIAKLPKRIDLRREQYVWLMRYWKWGGRCYIVVRVGKLGFYAWEGQYAKQLYDGKDIFNIPHKKFELNKVGWSDFGKFLIGEL